MVSAVGLEVVALHRTQFAGITLKGLSRNNWAELTEREMRKSSSGDCLLAYYFDQASFRTPSAILLAMLEKEETLVKRTTLIEHLRDCHHPIVRLLWTTVLATVVVISSARFTTQLLGR